jgi:hypothetical protein
MISTLLTVAVAAGTVLFQSSAGQIYQIQCKTAECETPEHFGDETWREYRIELEVRPEAAFAGVDFHVENDGWRAANVHFYESTAEIQMGNVLGSVTSWKIWPSFLAARPLPKNEWSKMRIDVGEDCANIYVHGEEKPVATYRALTPASGGIRLRAFMGSASFRNLRVTALEPGSVKPELADPWAALNHPKTVRRWQISDESRKTWKDAEADSRGVLDLAAAFPRANTKHTAFARATISAPSATKQKAYVTYTDRFTLWSNGELVFQGKPRGWEDPDREKLGNSRLIPDQFEIELPLRQGENEILVRSEVTEPFGWGFWMRLE